MVPASGGYSNYKRLYSGRRQMGPRLNNFSPVERNSIKQVDGGDWALPR